MHIGQMYVEKVELTCLKFTELEFKFKEGSFTSLCRLRKAASCSTCCEPPGPQQVRIILGEFSQFCLLTESRFQGPVSGKEDLGSPRSFSLAIHVFLFYSPSTVCDVIHIFLIHKIAICVTLASKFVNGHRNQVHYQRQK